MITCEQNKKNRSDLWHVLTDLFSLRVCNIIMTHNYLRSLWNVLLWKGGQGDCAPSFFLCFSFFCVTFFDSDPPRGEYSRRDKIDARAISLDTDCIVPTKKNCLRYIIENLMV